MRSAIGKGLRRPKRFSASSPGAPCTVFPAQRRCFSPSDSRGIHRPLAPNRRDPPIERHLAAGRHGGGPLGGHRDTRQPCRFPDRQTCAEVASVTGKCPQKTDAAQGMAMIEARLAFGCDENGNARLSQLPSVSISGRNRSAPGLEQRRAVKRQRPGRSRRQLGWLRLSRPRPRSPGEVLLGPRVKHDPAASAEGAAARHALQLPGAGH
jgi:hypothetical protein